MLGAEGGIDRDVLGLENERLPGTALLQPVMRAGRRIAPSPPLGEARRHALGELQRLPERLRSLRTEAAFRPEASAALRALVVEVDRRQGLQVQAPQRCRA